MSVYVDPLLPVHSRANWRWETSCHLMADTIEELHAFAASIGIERRWFQTRPDFPHYDLSPDHRARAVELGAVGCSRREFVMKVRELRLVWAELDEP
jgi:hypothetical protein